MTAKPWHIAELLSAKTSIHVHVIIAQLTRATSNLVLWDDDLAGQCIFGVGNRMVENADATNHLAHLLHLIREITGVSNHRVCSGNLTGASTYTYMYKDGLDELKKARGSCFRYSN